MDGPSRRAPRTRPPGPPSAGPEGPGGTGGAGRHPFRGVLIAATVLVVGVVAVAFATGTADDLPWGAIAGIAVIMIVAYVVGGRRRMPPGDDG